MASEMDEIFIWVLRDKGYIIYYRAQNLKVNTIYFYIF